MMDGRWAWGYGHPGLFGMGLGMVLLWGLLIVAVVALLRWLAAGRRPDAAPDAPSALEILAQRYARGEIDRAEYEQKRRDLGTPAPGPGSPSS